MSVKQKAPTAASGARAIPSGLLYGLGAYGLWGLLPLHFMILAPAGPVEIVASRVIFSVVVCALLVALSRSWKAVQSAFLSPNVLAALVLAAVLIAINWLTYTYGVISGRAVEASLGYFINPLVSVLLGVLVLKERLRHMQWVAVSLGSAAVLVITSSYGQPPWIALTLACSFGSYGLVKKKVGGRIDSTTSLMVETLVLAPLLPCSLGRCRHLHFECQPDADPLRLRAQPLLAAGFWRTHHSGAPSLLRRSSPPTSEDDHLLAAIHNPLSAVHDCHNCS
jgi:chloramphenicol-sensitive protein RarD